MDDRPDLDAIRRFVADDDAVLTVDRARQHRADVLWLCAETEWLEAERDRLQTAIGRHRRRILHLGSYGHQVHDGTAAEQANLDLWHEGNCDG
jgi:hypothetical protein